MSLETAILTKIPKEPVWEQFREGELHIPDEEERKVHGEKPRLFYGYGKIKADEMLEEHCKELLLSSDNPLKVNNARKILKEGIGTYHYIVFLENMKKCLKMIEESGFPYLYVKIDEHNLAKKTFSGGLRIKRRISEMGITSTATFSKSEYETIKQYI